MPALDIRPCSEADLERVLASSTPAAAVHFRQCWAAQQAGEATWMLAWRGDAPCGRVTVLHRSKYDNVRAAIGDFPELNALTAEPPGQGIGSALIAAAEAHALVLGATRSGLAVEGANVGARRLYERLGYRDWDRGSVVDRWTEHGADGEPSVEHADLCHYLVKALM